MAAAPISRPATGTGIPPLAIGLIAAVTLFWGVNWPAMKAAVSEVSPWLFRSVCVTVSAVCLLAFAAVSGETVRLRRPALAAVILPALFGVTAWNMFSALGLRQTAGGHAAILAYTMPVWTALLAVPLLGERIDARRAGALLLGLAGVAVLAGPDLLSGGDLLGPLYMLLAAMAWGVGIVTLKLRPSGLGAVALTGWQLALGAVPILLATAVIEPRPDLSHLTWRGVAGIAYATVIGLTLCFAAYNKVVLMLPAGVAAVSVLLIPPVGLFSSALLLGEPVGARELASLVLVVAAVSLVLLPRRA